MNKRRTLKVLSFALLCSAALPVSVSANYFSGGRTSAILSAYYDPSVSSYGYTTIFDDGRTNWRGISSRVNIFKTDTNNSTADEYYAGTTSNTGLLGFAQPYKTILGFNYMASATDTWSYCVISLYDNQINASTSGSNPPGLTRAEIVSSVTTHEIGHSLSLAHPPSGTVSVMSNGPITNYPPTAYDKAELIKKWGN